MSLLTCLAQAILPPQPPATSLPLREPLLRISIFLATSFFFLLLWGGVPVIIAFRTFFLLFLWGRLPVIVAAALKCLEWLQWIQANFSAIEWVMELRARNRLGKTRLGKTGIIAIVVGLLVIVSLYVHLQEKEKELIEMDDSIAVDWMLDGSNPQHYGFCHGLDCPKLWSNHIKGCSSSRFSASYLINSLLGSRLIFVNETNHWNILQRERQNLTPSAVNAFKFSVYLSIQLLRANPIHIALTLDSETCGPFIVAWRRRRSRRTIEELAEEFPDVLVEVPLSAFEELSFSEETVIDFFCPFVKDIIWCLC